MAKDEHLEEMARIKAVPLQHHIEHVRKHGTFRDPADLRFRLLNAMEVDQHINARAENVIHLGCDITYRLAFGIRSYLTLLDRLGVEYAFLEKEYCCGATFLAKADEREKPRAVAAIEEVRDLNVAAAQKQGAKNIVYMCDWCVYVAKGYAVDSPMRHMFYIDLILEKLRHRRVRVAPSVVGYYEGCHTNFQALVPEVTLDYAPYRALLDRIEGLRLVEVDGPCCSYGADEILAKAQRLNLDTIVSPCDTCHVYLKQAAGGKMRVKFYADLLLEALDGRVVVDR